MADSLLLVMYQPDLPLPLELSGFRRQIAFSLHFSIVNAKIHPSIRRIKGTMSTNSCARRHHDASIVHQPRQVITSTEIMALLTTDDIENPFTSADLIAPPSNSIALPTSNNLGKRATSTDTMTPQEMTPQEIKVDLDHAPGPRDASFPFMKLSPELRNRIYEYAFTSEEKSGLAPHALTRTNRQIRAESLGMYYSLVELIEVPLLSLKQEGHFEQWLKTDLKRYSVLPHLSLAFPSTNGVARIDVCCTRLVLVDITRRIRCGTLSRRKTPAGDASNPLNTRPGEPLREALDRLYDGYAALPGVRVRSRSENHRVIFYRCTEFVAPRKTSGGSRLGLRCKVRP